MPATASRRKWFQGPASECENGEGGDIHVRMILYGNCYCNYHRKESGHKRDKGKRKEKDRDVSASPSPERKKSKKSKKEKKHRRKTPSISPSLSPSPEPEADEGMVILPYPLGILYFI